MLAQTGDLIECRQLPFDLMVGGDVQRMLLLEVPQLVESLRGLVAGLGELHDDVALFRDLASTSLDVPKDQRKLLLKNDAARLRCVLAGHRCLPVSRKKGGDSGGKSSDPYDVSTCAGPGGNRWSQSTNEEPGRGSQLPLFSTGVPRRPRSSVGGVNCRNL